MENYVGKRLDGRYELSEILGIGGMAVVYKAYDNVEARTVAVKILKEEYTNNEEFIRRFKNESKAIAVLSHPNIVKVYDVSFGQRLQYIVMEYIDGITLKQLIEQQGSLRWKDALLYTVQILRALSHAHDHGIVHRDVKPQNIMVLADGTIKVTDFGIARFARSEQKTITDKAIGSVHYISPEQARGDNTDEKSDIYSVGVILYEMLTGQLPFQAESAVSVAIMQLQRDPEPLTKINGSIPVGLEQITMHAMEKAPERRYQSASEMLCDLENFKRDPSLTFDYGYYVDEEPTRFLEEIPSSHAEKAKQAGKDKPLLPIIAGIMATFLAALLIILLIFVPKLTGRTEDIACPNFMGQKYEEVEKQYGKTFKLTAKYESSEEEKGTVIAQSIKAEHKIKKNQEITLTVSSGAKTVTVADVTDQAQEVAVSNLEKAGFTTEIVQVTDNDIAEGRVVRTMPAKGSQLPVGTKITVYVSTGKATVMVSVPDCRGLSKDQAVKLLESRGLVAGNIREENNTDKKASKGTVLSQTPVSGEVGKGSAVDLVVSTGYFEVTVEVQIPRDPAYISNTGYIGIWEGNECLCVSKKIDFTANSTYKLTYTTDTDTLNGTVKISTDNKAYENYQDISVDNKSGKLTVYKTYKYSTAEN